MLKMVFPLIAALPLMGCVTTPETKAKEMAYCERMEREMGVTHIHDHADAKGMGLNPMSVTHDRCRQMLGIS
jgi:hypothetical protein